MADLPSRAHSFPYTDVFYTQVGFALLGRRFRAQMTDGRASQTFREKLHEDWSADDSRL